MQFRFRYATDGGLHFDGPFLDDLALTLDSVSTWADDVESGENGWTAKGLLGLVGTVTRCSSAWASRSSSLKK